MSKIKKSEDRLLSTRQASKLLGFDRKSTQAVRVLINKGKIPAVRINSRNIRIWLSDLHAYIDGFKKD